MNKKLIKNILIYSLVFLVCTTGIAVALLYAYQDKIIELFVTEANKHIKTKVQVGKISLSLLDKFPQVSVTLDKVVVTESVADSQAPLASLEQAYFTFSLWDLLWQNYRIRQIYLDSGEIQVKVLENGSVNYEIIRTDTAAADDRPMAFDLEKIALKNVAISYADRQQDQHYQFLAHNVQASLAFGAANIDIDLKGDALVKTIRIGDHAYFANKEVQLDTRLAIDKPEQHITIKPSVVQVGPAAYQLAGSFDYTGDMYLDLKLEGKNTSIQSMLALLPEQFTEKAGRYQSTGNVYFSGHIKGIASASQNPAVNITFGCRNVSFFHPEYKQKIENLRLEGSFTNGSKQNLATTAIGLKNIQGTLHGKPFSGNVSYRNFADPTLELDLKAELDLAHVTGIFPVEAIRSAAGTAKVDCSFAGNLRTLKINPAGNTVKTAGEISLQNVALHLRDYPVPLQNLSGHFMLRKNDVAVTGFKGKAGQSDFKLNGYFKNVVAWLLLENQPLLVESDFESDFLNFDELLAVSQPSATASADAGNPAGNSAAADYKLVVSPKIAFDLNTTVKKMQFRRFRSANLRGNIKLKNQVLSSPAISLQTIGGRFAIKGSVDARKRDQIKASTVVRLQDMEVDSLFYIFENFGQDFLVQQHLKGTLTADITSDLYFDSHLNAKNDQLQAEIKAIVRNGQLNNFEPIQKLGVFVKRRELNNLHFAEIRNNFWIQNRTVYIPEMEIRSSASSIPSIFLAGTHTFDQQMDYKFRIPLAKSDWAETDEANILPVAHKSGPTLFLTLKGNENNFKIAYDTDRVKTKIADDLKREKQELKQAFKAPVKEKEKPVEIAEDEYFDF